MFGACFKRFLEGGLCFRQRYAVLRPLRSRHCRHYSSEIEGTLMRRAEDGRYAFVFVRHRPRVVVARGQVRLQNVDAAR